MSDLNEIITLVGQLSPVETITGHVTAVDFHLHPLEDGEGFNIVDSQGNIINDFSPEEQVEALHGNITLPDVVSPAAYPGPYSVTPADEAQTIPVRGFYMESDLTIDPVPSNYGLITWNGSILTVS